MRNVPWAKSNMATTVETDKWVYQQQESISVESVPARLPTVRVIVATTRCRYWGRYARCHAGQGGTDIHTHPFPCTYPLPLDIPLVHTTLPKIYPLDIPSPIQKGPGTRHTYPHPRRDLEPGISTHPHLLNPITTPISSPPPPPGGQNDCQMRVKILPFRNYCWAHLSLKYSQWTQLI